MIMPALNETSEDGPAKGDRIAKVIARSGLCSRRDAEVLIGEKRVSVNGAVIESAALDVLPSDKVLVDGKPLASREPPRLWRYHKPKGRVTTHKDPEGRPTVFEALPEGLPRLISVGRLDFNTEGLLLLTNDGDLARHLELPSTGWARRYRVRAFGQIEQSKLNELAAGLRTGGVNYGPIEAALEREQGDNVWITLAIREGKNREVRRIMEHLGLAVNRLIRVSFGPFMLGDLEPGQIEEVKTSVLKDQLGPRLARQLGVKREVMRQERRLPPTRSKPTYLRRKPSAPERPERPVEERPLKRRRVLQMDGSEAPRVELVPEKKRRPGRFGEGGPAPERPYRRSREERPEREGRERGPRREGGRRWSEEPDREAHAGGDRPLRREEGRGGGERPPFAARNKTGERPRWKTRSEQGEERPRARFRPGEGGDRPFRQDRGPERSGEDAQGRRPDRRPYRERRIGEGHGGGEKPKSFGKPFRRDRDGDPTSRSSWRDREAGERRAPGGEGSGERPQRPERRSFKRPGRDEGAAESGKPRSFEKRSSKGPRRAASARGESGERRTPRNDASGERLQRAERRPYRTDEGAGEAGKPGAFGKRQFKGPRRQQSARGEGGKPFKRGGGFAPKSRPDGPRKPRPETGEDTP
jgi:23S rRNA pseudouridine2605 synthase